MRHWRREYINLQFNQRLALVAGASRGLSRGIGVALAAEGAQVAAVARNLWSLTELAAASPSGGSIAARECDLSEAAAIDALSGPLARVDILILNTRRSAARFRS